MNEETARLSSITNPQSAIRNPQSPSVAKRAHAWYYLTILPHQQQGGEARGRCAFALSLARRRFGSLEEMSLKSRTRVLAAFVAVFVALASSGVAAEKKSKKKMPRGTPIMWRNRGVESLDLFDGPGGKSGWPDLRRLRLSKSEAGGYSPKFRVRESSARGGE